MAKKKKKKQNKKNTATNKAKKKPANSAKQRNKQKSTTKNKSKQKKQKQSIKQKVYEHLHKAKVPVIIISLAVAFLSIFQFSSLILTYVFLNNTPPGTKVAGADISSLSKDEVENLIQQRAKSFSENPINIKLDDKEIELMPDQLGIQLDIESTLINIAFVNFDNSNLATILSTAVNGNNYPVNNTIDINLALKNIENELNFAEQKTENAYLTFENGFLKVVPEKQGKQIDISKLYNDLKRHSSGLRSKPIYIKAVESAPLVTSADLESELEDIHKKLSQQINLEYQNFNFYFKPIDYIDTIRFDYKDELKIGEIASFDLELESEGLFDLGEAVSLNKKLNIKILEDPFNQYIDENLSPLLESESESVKIWRDEEGEIIFEGKGKDGKEISRTHLLTAMNMAINNGINKVPVPVHLQPAEVDISEDLQKLGIKELIATGKSAFAGSTSNRIHNINTGISKFHGYIIKPGETFSFNTILGPVEAYTGFLPELVIKPEGTIPEYGGGLCQVSSTIYRAALFAGLPIVERTPHSYAVSYYSQVYGWGLDATIYPGVHDVRFKNDTPGHILIQGYTDGINAYFKFYGTGDGRSVELEGPYIGGYRSPGPTQYIETDTLAPGQQKWMESAHTGFNANWFRHLTKPDGETIVEPLYTTYKAIPAKVLVGAGEGVTEEDIAKSDSETED